MYPTYGTYEVETIMQHRHTEANSAVQTGLPARAKGQRQPKNGSRPDKRIGLMRWKRMTYR